MPEDVRIWEVGSDDELTEIQQSKLNLEERIEKWLEKDISILSGNLLVIGRQVKTGFGGFIDILCLDNNGDAVVVELKRDKTPRDVTAQALDYTSWVKTLSNEDITKMSDEYLGEGGPLEEAYKKAMDETLPDVLNENQKMLIVGSEIDASTERIIKYLSDIHVGINAVTFHYYQDSAKKELLARVFLIEPEEVEYKSARSSKRKPNLTYEELQDSAEKNGVGKLYKQMHRLLSEGFYTTGTTRSTASFIGMMGGRRNTIFHLQPGESSSTNGLKFWFYLDRFAEHTGKSEQEVIDSLPDGSKREDPWKGSPPAYVGYFKNDASAQKIIDLLAGYKKSQVPF